MMWEYDPPRDEAVYINESTTWIYKRSSNQVIKSVFKEESYSQIPIAMLTNLEHMKDDFDISMPEENALQLIPKHRIGYVKTIVLELTKGEFPIKMFTIIDTYGNIVMIELSDIKINSGLKDSIFKFTPPEGAEIYTVE
jgi:outer membrane lipoprotein carrier protein